MGEVGASLWVLARPRGTVWVAVLPLVGFGFAHWDHARNLVNGAGMVALYAAWCLVSAGALWLNAALDRDQGEVLFGRAVPVPREATAAGYAALLGAVALAGWAGPFAGLCAAGCAVLAVLYSHPATAYKAHPVGGPVVNAVGYGLLSPLAGGSLVGVPLTARAAATLLVVVALVLASYFGGQAFQSTEDGRRGYRTLVVTHGPGAALGATRALLWLAALAVVALAVVGWYPRPCLLALLPFAWADRHLDAWSLLPGGGSERHARELLRRILATGAVLVGAALAVYARDSLVGGPVAGLATAGGHP